jgi:signal transduction histidine kinase
LNSNPVQKQYAPLLYALPAPSLLVQGRQAILWNQPAERLLPRLKYDPQLPDALFPSLSSRSAGMATIQGKPYSVQASPVDDTLLLLTLTPVLRTELSSDRLRLLGEQLRLQLSDLILSAQVLMSITAGLNRPEANRSMALLERALYRLLRLTRHLELMQQPDLGYRSAPFDLAGFCAQFAGEVAPLLRAAEVELHYRSELSSLLTCGDVRLLQLLLLTLLSNSVKAAGVGGAITFSLGRTASHALLQLEDNGPGLSPDALSRLFDDEAVPPPAPGSGLGLGLALARRIVALHHGTLVAGNVPNHGLSIAISLPLNRAGGSLPLSSPPPDRDGGFSPLLVELSDALPTTAFTPDDME